MRRLYTNMITPAAGRMPPGTKIADSEVLYLLYDVQTGHVRCNADQEKTSGNFGLADVADFDLREPQIRSGNQG